ncbi:MAG: class D beta-lactamase [bacterium]|nr:class D beta-lactamase [bacterium]
MNAKLLFSFLLFAFFINSCGTTEKEENNVDLNEEDNKVEVPDFQSVIDSAGLNGAILIFDEINYYSNNFEWAKKRHLPASTFKIPNSIIALELGVVESDSTISTWDGEPRNLKTWERDMVFRDAFHLSCVPCYQEVARKIGAKRMKNFVNQFNYGKMDIDASNIDMFWLEGKSGISQMEQIEFLRAFNEQRLQISPETYTTMRRMMIIEANDGFTLRGKTGWSVTNDQDNCWFVGWVETPGGNYYFATNVEPGDDTESEDLFTLRKNITYKALELIAR